MFKGQLYLSILLLLSAFSFSGTVLSQGCDSASHQDSDYWTMLELMNAGGCFQADKNSSPLAQAVDQTLNNSSDKKYQRAIKALTTIQQDLQRNADINSAALTNAIATLIKDITDHPGAPRKDLKNDWKLGNKLDRLPDALEPLDLEAQLRIPQCEAVANGQCNSAFNTAAELLRTIHLANAAVDKYTENYRAESYAERSLRRAKWDSYYDDLTFQYPWELMVNNFVLEYYDSRADEDGNKKGFRDLPRSKLVLLHPEANLVYADNAQDEYEITLTLEAIGYETFDFNAKGKVKNTMGISLLAAYMDQSDRPKSGWTGGLLFKYNGYSLGVTDNHGDTGIVFNINLSQRIFDVKDRSRRYYDEFQDKIQVMGKLVEEGQQKLDEVKQMFQISE